ncbi:MAG: 2OG-Fe(II) oxygenase [Candidatus Hodarchaeales archaeon]|jgi:hypothetical protein
MNNLFKESLKFNFPYDHLICDNFLKDYHLFDRAYPIDYLGKSIRMNRDLTYGDPLYEKIYETPFKNLHDYVYSEKFISDFLKIFNDEIEKKLNNDELLFDPRSVKIKPQPYELRNFISRNNRINNETFLFPRIDFGVGFSGYGVNNGGRGVHTDNVTRLISIMLFFTDQSEITDGQHQMFKIDEKYNPIMTKSVEVKKNRLLASIQSNDAYHSVNPLKFGERRAIYMSISSSNKIWKDYKDPILKRMSKNRR